MSDGIITIAHVMHRFAMGGLENGVVNLVNHLSKDRYRHVIVSLTDYDHSFATRLTADNVRIVCLHKKAGKDFRLYWRAYKLFKSLRPDVVHSRNLSAIEMLLPAWAAGVKKRIHSEHGRDESDASGHNRKNQWIRRIFLSLAQRKIALSSELKEYLVERVGQKPESIALICNGVDCKKFTPAQTSRLEDTLHFIFVGRLQAVKNPLLAIQAFQQFKARQNGLAATLSLVGDGPLMAECQKLINDQELTPYVTLLGARRDVASLMQGSDVFILSSNAEGISNTILEAMASGLAVIATNVGGNKELVEHARTGFLTPFNDAKAMAEAMAFYAQQREQLEGHQRAARLRAEQVFSLQGMLERYHALYQWQ